MFIATKPPPTALNTFLPWLWNQFTAIQAAFSNYFTSAETDARYVVAAYGGLKMTAPSVVGFTIGVAYATVTQFDALAITPKYITPDVPTDSLAIQYPGIYQMTLNMSLDHNSVNAGRSFNARLYDTTAAAPIGSAYTVGVGRDETSTAFSMAVLTEVLGPIIGHKLVLQLGGAVGGNIVVSQTNVTQWAISSVSEIQ